MPTRPVEPAKDPQNPHKPEPATAHPAPEVRPQQPVASPPSTLSVTAPLLKDHSELRMLLGELRGALDQFELSVIRRAIIEIQRLVDRHALQEESGLYLVGMKVLRADNSKLPELFYEHHKTFSTMANFIRALYSPRLTNVEEELRNMGYVLIDDMLHHLQDEEQVVWPALERLLPDEMKQVILKRYRMIHGDAADELERTPLISMPDFDDGSNNLPAAGVAAQVFPPQAFRNMGGGGY